MRPGTARIIGVAFVEPAQREHRNRRRARQPLEAFPAQQQRARVRQRRQHRRQHREVDAQFAGARQLDRVMARSAYQPQRRPLTQRTQIVGAQMPGAGW